MDESVAGGEFSFGCLSEFVSGGEARARYDELSVYGACVDGSE